MKKNKIKFILLAFVACLLMYGCDKARDVKFNFKTPPCMYYEGKIYWEVTNVEDINNAEYLGKVKITKNMKMLPDENFYMNSESKTFIDHEIFKKDNFLYIEFEEGYRQFAYYNQMELEKEDVLLVKETDIVHIPNANRPHFVYKGMRYYMMGNNANEDDVTSFKEVGKIKTMVHYAAKDLSGNLDIGSLLYASETQNRFMIVKYTEGGIYEYYENQAYVKDEE